MVDKMFQVIIHLMSTSYAPEGFTTTQKKKFFIKAIDFMLTARQLYKMGPDEIFCECVFKQE